jgi:membrane protein
MSSSIRASARAQRHVGRLAHALRTWPYADTLRTLRQRFREDRLALTAGALTFTTVISLVPLMTVMLAIFTAFPIFGKFQAALQQYLLESLVPENIARPVLRELTSFAGKASRLGGAGFVVLVVAAVALVLTIDRTLNAIWRVREPRPLSQRLLLYWAALTLGPLLSGMSLSLTSYAISESKGIVEALPGGLALLLALLEFGLLAAGSAAMFRFVPNVHVRWAHAWAGGIFVAFGFLVAKRGLAWYVTTVPTISVVYGTFATVPILLMWIYLGWVVVLLGAVIAAYAPSLAMRAMRMPDRPGQRFALAVSVLRALAAQRGRPPHGLTLEALATTLRIDPLQIEPVLETLHALDWCSRLDDVGPPRYVLLIEPSTSAASPLIDRLLLDDRAATGAFRARAGLAHMTVADLIG